MEMYMKATKSILGLIFFALVTGCVESKQSSDDLVTIDVTKDYPEKELSIQDFFDVEYISLETTDDFITQGIIMDIGKDVIIVKNRANDGDIFIFDRAGKALRKINRRGQGAEEYSQSTRIILDEENNEIFVYDYPARTILVYDLYGKYKRHFRFAENSYYMDIFNYDRDNLIGYKIYSGSEVENEPLYHMLLSKEDGRITWKISTSFKEIKTPVLTIEELEAVFTPSYHTTIPYAGKWALMNPSSDTIYTFLPDGNISPLIKREPSIHDMETEVFLYPMAITDRYYFMRTQRKEFDLEKMKWITATDLVLDKQENSIHKYVLYNDDFVGRREYIFSKTPNNGIVYWDRIDAYTLIEADEEGKLNGRLKEIAANLDEEDNPVIMIVKHKK